MIILFNELDAIVEPTAQFWDDLFATRHEEAMREKAQLLGILLLVSSLIDLTY